MLMMTLTRLFCSWREDELIDRMKLDSDHEKQVKASLSRFIPRNDCA
jgi:hypothetical protein